MPSPPEDGILELQFTTPLNRNAVKPSIPTALAATTIVGLSATGAVAIDNDVAEMLLLAMTITAAVWLGTVLCDLARSQTRGEVFPLHTAPTPTIHSTNRQPLPGEVLAVISSMHRDLQDVKADGRRSATLMKGIARNVRDMAASYGEGAPATTGGNPLPPWPLPQKNEGGTDAVA